ncbi:NADH dehydrogenase [ubiquinone] 1 alpha subcomplex subunit 6 isoform X2 [Vespa velutina]|uniref:NADH dehydrogenase [ubiquinone] 1 alpha subcomplex subunit 6 isoform X2 n=1 Tax=Vespa velutina TaxID=202808 RepID=UPI001FB1A267|nr:NADH dehydrogenase [ubiquinone] 1 alpha subcomplex subunit 6 isoform X2 [Vespa velutina]
MASPSVARITRQARPILSSNHAEALIDYDIPYTRKQCLEKLRSEFLKNKYVTDVRVIDLLVIKGHMELTEVINIWKPVGNLLNHFKDTYNPKPKDFLGKFYAGHE